MGASRSGLSSNAEREAPAGSVLDRVFREEAGRLTASLVRLLGDFDLAEEMVSEAMVEALRRWPAHGIPERPGAWLHTTARNRGLDRLRREKRYGDKLAELAALPDSVEREPDDRLRLIFTCCHPALDPVAQVALTLRAVGGLTTPEISRAFMVSEAALAKRLSRAKRKIVEAGIPYRAPDDEELPERLVHVLRVVYLVFNEGLLTTAGDRAVRRDLVDDAEWLAALVAAKLENEPEPLGLLALIRLSRARWATRIGPDGRLVALPDQDRSEWDRSRIADAVRLIERAAALGRPGPYQIEASIAALHCEAGTWEETDWPQILALYDLLTAIDHSAVVRLNRAVALHHVAGPAPALAELDRLAARLDRYHLFHSTRAELLRASGLRAEAERSDRRALELTANPAERFLLLGRLGPDGRLELPERGEQAAGGGESWPGGNP